MELKFSKGTDSEHEIKLDSHLIYAAWRKGVVYAGQSASVEVVTAFVGNGADIELTGKSEGGKKLGKLKGKIKNNKYIGSFDIPDDTEIGDEVYFEVKLSKNSLNGESNRVPVRPGVRVSNMQWSAPEARRGDTLTLSAYIANISDGTEVLVTIYEHDQDSAHDKIVELPAVVTDGKIELLWEYEYYEDTDEIPTQAEMERYGGSYNPPEYFFTVKVGETEYGVEQESGLLEFKDWLELELRDPDDNPIGEIDYVLTLADGSERQGTLDENGYAREDGIPPGVCTVQFARRDQE